MIRLAARAATLALIGVFVALGIWQVQRLGWKNDLIARVDARLVAAPVEPPAGVSQDDEYTRVIVRGRYRPSRETYVQAVTELGGGFWVMTPLDTPRGTVLINRGFVRSEQRGKTPPPTDPVVVVGLLRLNEPDGGFLRANDSKTDRWYSRDVNAIAVAKAVGPVAPYFIDAGANGRAWPRGGLTVVRFRNSHLSYALTWFAMAGLLAFLAWRAMKRG